MVGIVGPVCIAARATAGCVHTTVHAPPTVGDVHTAFIGGLIGGLVLGVLVMLAYLGNHAPDDGNGRGRWRRGRDDGPVSPGPLDSGPDDDAPHWINDVEDFLKAVAEKGRDLIGAGKDR